MEIRIKRVDEAVLHSLAKFSPLIVLTSATVFFAYDITTDLLKGDESLVHIFVEGIIFFAISAMLFIELRRVRRLESQVHTERERVGRLSGELLLNIRQQFEVWNLSPSECEVAMLLIKGLSMKEVSLAREVKEKTVRQQAASIYNKSGCAGRSELAAYFIEDLFD